MVACTREGAELLSQYGWESRWNTRAERWPLVEDRSVLLEDSMEDMLSEGGFSIGNTRLELSSPVSNLDFIAEEHFQPGKAGLSRSGSISGCDAGDCESGIHIPDIQSRGHAYSPELNRHGLGHRLKSHTLPLPGPGSSSTRNQNLPFRSHTFRSIALPQFSRDRTKSFEHISSTAHKEFDISHEHRSHSFHFQLKHKHKSDSHKHKHDSHKHKSDSNKVKSVIHDSPISSSMDMSTVDASTNDSAMYSSALQSDSSRTKAESVNTSNDIEDHRAALNIIPSDASITMSSADVVLKIIEPGDDGYKSDNKSEKCEDIHQPNVHQVETGKSGIEISITDTDMESKDIKSENENQENQNQTNESGIVSENIPNQPDEPDACNVKEDESSVQNIVKSTFIEREEGSVNKNGSVKEERSSSSESSRTSKSRAESFNTDSMTSGISSYDSGHHGVMEYPSLSPIVSTNSLDNIDVQLRHKEKKEHTDTVHHSSYLRRMSNLTRVPTIRRQSSSSSMGLPSSNFVDYSENAIMYTTARDALGYATLRSLAKNRTSLDVESDYGLNSLYDNMGSMTSINRRPSIDSMTEMKRPSR